MNDAEVMTTALTAALCWRGKHASARAMRKQHGYISQMVSKSRCSRRLHRLKEPLMIVFNLLGHLWNTLNTDAVYVIDSLPVMVCVFHGFLPPNPREGWFLATLREH
jgi:hypothetical protein